MTKIITLGTHWSLHLDHNSTEGDKLTVNLGHVTNITSRLKFYVIVISTKVVSNATSEFLIWGKSEKSNKFWCL